MANILYGINGEGSGHWTRSKEVIDHLKESGHEVIIVASGRALPNLKKHFQVEEIFGFNFVYTKDKVNELATFLKNLKFIPGGVKSLNKILRLIKERDIELIITDTEPISCAVSTLKKIPSISIDNQHFITNTNAFKPTGYDMHEDVAKTSIVIKMMTPFANSYLTVSFFEAMPKNKKTFVVPPIVRREFFDLKPTHGNYVLVYLNHGYDKITETLKSVNYKFIFYGTSKLGQDGNVVFKSFDQAEFINDLANAGGVLATAGFSLISEALYLKKPYLAWPAKRQFEQTFNAYHLERLGYGKYVKNLTPNNIELFISNLDVYKRNLAPYPYKDNQLLFNKLDELIEKLV